MEIQERHRIRRPIMVKVKIVMKKTSLNVNNLLIGGKEWNIHNLQTGPITLHLSDIAFFCSLSPQKLPPFKGLGKWNITGMNKSTK